MEACGVLWFAAAHIRDIDLHEIKDLKLMICVASFDLKQLLVWKFMEILSLVWIHLCVVLISVMICLSSPVGVFIHQLLFGNLLALELFVIRPELFVTNLWKV